MQKTQIKTSAKNTLLHLYRPEAIGMEPTSQPDAHSAGRKKKEEKNGRERNALLHLIIRKRLVRRHEVLLGLPVEPLHDARVSTTSLLQPLRLKRDGSPVASASAFTLPVGLALVLALAIALAIGSVSGRVIVSVIVSIGVSVSVGVRG